MDPFLDLIRLLRPQATLWGGIEGAGQWGVSFSKRDDLLFCWLEKGECYLTRPTAPPVFLGTGDFVLIRTLAPFTLTSDPAAVPQASEALVAATNRSTLRLGASEDADVLLHGGRFVFDTANEGLLSGLLPEFVHIPAADVSSKRIRTLLEMNHVESSNRGPGSEFIIGRLMELILVEILRNQAHHGKGDHSGLLAGLGDHVTKRALLAMHAEVDRHWTVSSLAHECGVSRSAFAARFSRVMGIGPMQYLLHWRVALAKDQLRRRTQSVGEIAFSVGFQSSSAFSTAFSRVTGTSPKEFAVSVR
jgi:AraC-like DNA-binding protein